MKNKQSSPKEKSVYVTQTTVNELCTTEDIRASYRVTVKQPLAERDVLIAAKTVPDSLTLLNAVARCFNAQWNEGKPLARMGENVLRLPSEMLRYDAALWRKLLGRVAEPLNQLARYSRRPPEYWQHFGSANPQDPFLAGYNRQALALTHWHARLKLWAVLSAQQKEEVLGGTTRLVALSQAQEALIAQSLTNPGPYYYIHERPITKEQHLAVVAELTNFYVENGYPLDLRQDAISCAITTFAPFTLVPSSSPPFPVRGNPYPQPLREFFENGSFLEWESFSFPGGFRQPDFQSSTWSAAVADFTAQMPGDFLLISDDFAPAEEVRCRRAVPRRPTPASAIARKAESGGKNTSLAKALDLLCEAFDRVWWREDNVLFFRHQYWYSAQRYTPPIRLVARLKAAFSVLLARGLSSQVVSEIIDILGDFSFEQLQGVTALLDAAPLGSSTYSSADAFMHASGMNISPTALECLRYSRHLTSEQQQAAMSSDGLPFARLTAQQRETLPFDVRLLNAWKWSQQQPGKSPVFKIKATIVPSGVNPLRPLARPVPKYFRIAFDYGQTSFTPVVSFVLSPDMLPER